MYQINQAPLDYFCFSDNCNGTNYKDLGEAQKCLKEHSEYLLSNLDIERRSMRLQDKRMISDEKILKNDISGIQLILKQIQEYVDSVYFVQNIPELLKTNVIQVSSEFHNNFTFIYEPSYRQLQFTSQIKLLDGIVSRFQEVEQKIKETYQKIQIIKDESIKDIEILDFSIEEYKILGNISQENLQIQIQNQKKKKINQNQSEFNKQDGKENSVKIKKFIKKTNKNAHSERDSIKNAKQLAKEKHKMKIESQEKIQIIEQQQQEQNQQQDQQQQIQKPKMNQQENEIILSKNEKQGKQQSSKNSFDDTTFEVEEELQIVQQNKIISQQFNNPILLQRPTIQYQNNLISLNTKDQIEFSIEEQNKNNKLLKKMKDDQKLNEQVLFISENEQEFNIYIYSNYPQEVQILKGKSEGFQIKNSCMIENYDKPEVLFKNVKKCQIQQFDQSLYSVNLQSDGYLHFYHINNHKKSESLYKSDTNYTDFYTFADQYEGCIYIFAFKKELYKVLKFPIHTKSQNRVKQIKTKNLTDSNIFDMNFLYFEKNQSEREMIILIHSQKSLFMQETDFKDFYDEIEIPYQGYICFMRLIRHDNNNYYAIVGIDHTISLYDYTNTKLVKKIYLEKKYGNPLDLKQISNQIILIVQTQGVFLYNLNNSTEYIYSPTCIDHLSDIETFYSKELFAYALFKIEQSYHLKKYNVLDIKRSTQLNSYSEQEGNQLQF